MFLGDGRMIVSIEPRTVSIGKMHLLLSKTTPSEILISRSQSSEKRGIEPSVLVAAIGTGGTLLGILITSLFRLLQDARASRMVIVGATGRKVEISSNASDEELARAIDAAKSIDTEKISILP